VNLVIWRVVIRDGNPPAGKTGRTTVAAGTGDQASAQALAGHADALAAGSKIPHRLANALYCRALLDRDAARLLVAAERYGDASRPLLRAKALEAAAGYFVDAGDRAMSAAAPSEV
jgi:hypothetical protein